MRDSERIFFATIACSFSDDKRTRGVELIRRDTALEFMQEPGEGEGSWGKVGRAGAPSRPHRRSVHIPDGMETDLPFFAQGFDVSISVPVAPWLMQVEESDTCSTRVFDVARGGGVDARRGNMQAPGGGVEDLFGRQKRGRFPVPDPLSGRGVLGLGLGMLADLRAVVSMSCDLAEQVTVPCFLSMCRSFSCSIFWTSWRFASISISSISTELSIRRALHMFSVRLLWADPVSTSRDFCPRL